MEHFSGEEALRLELTWFWGNYGRQTQRTTLQRRAPNLLQLAEQWGDPTTQVGISAVQDFVEKAIDTYLASEAKGFHILFGLGAHKERSSEARIRQAAVDFQKSASRIKREKAELVGRLTSAVMQLAHDSDLRLTEPELAPSEQRRRVGHEELRGEHRSEPHVQRDDVGALLMEFAAVSAAQLGTLDAVGIFYLVSQRLAIHRSGTEPSVYAAVQQATAALVDWAFAQHVHHLYLFAPVRRALIEKNLAWSTRTEPFDAWHGPMKELYVHTIHRELATIFPEQEVSWLVARFVEASGHEYADFLERLRGSDRGVAVLEDWRHFVFTEEARLKVGASSRLRWRLRKATLNCYPDVTELPHEIELEYRFHFLDCFSRGRDALFDAMNEHAGCNITTEIARGVRVFPPPWHRAFPDDWELADPNYQSAIYLHVERLVTPWRKALTGR